MTSEADSVRLLVEHDRLEEAAALAEARGRHAEARELWERACRFGDAARAALLGGDPRRAIVLAARAGDGALEAEAAASLSADPALARAAAGALDAAGEHAARGRLLLSIGDYRAAGEAFGRARLPRAAGDAFERAERWQAAQKAYRTAVAIDPDDAEARLRLGRLMSRAGDDAAAVRALQRIAPGTPERAAALPLLRKAFERLGLAEAAAHVSPAPPETSGEQPTIQSAELLFGRYELRRHVATTSTARLFEAIDRLSDAHVALKVLRVSGLTGRGRDAAARFEREARALAELKHPQIAPLLGFLPDVPALVLKWMAGGSLADMLAREAVSPARAVEIALSLCSALATAHRRGILHRDVKPSNVLFDETGRAQLADFGAAHIGDLAETMTAGLFGTIGYMAPEVRGGAAATPSSDVYGVGAVLWHALTGGPPPLELPFLSETIGHEQERVARRLIAVQCDRPATAPEAETLLRSVEWSDARPPTRMATVPIPALDSARLTTLDGARHHDRWLDRELYVVPSTDTNLALARALASSSHPALPVVFARLENEGAIWVEAPPRAPLAAGRLSSEDLVSLRGALSELHCRGVAHGAVDREHLYRDGAARLAFPLRPGPTSPERDLADLERLAGEGAGPTLP